MFSIFSCLLLISVQYQSPGTVAWEYECYGEHSTLLLRWPRAELPAWVKSQPHFPPTPTSAPVRHFFLCHIPTTSPIKHITQSLPSALHSQYIVMPFDFFSSNLLQNGRWGVIDYGNGCRYTGQFKEGKFTGKGFSSCLVLSCLVSCLVLSCLAFPSLILSCLAFPGLILSCLVLFYIYTLVDFPVNPGFLQTTEGTLMPLEGSVPTLFFHLPCVLCSWQMAQQIPYCMPNIVRLQGLTDSNSFWQDGECSFYHLASYKKGWISDYEECPLIYMQDYSPVWESVFFKMVISPMLWE